MEAEMKSHTRFPQLPVLGHVPKKRAKPPVATLTMDEILAVCDEQYMNADDHQVEWGIQCVQRALYKAAVAKARVKKEG
jgi:hypothetical protein